MLSRIAIMLVHSLRPISFLFLSMCFLAPAFAQRMIMNEVFNSSGNDEWIEFLVTQDSTDIRSWGIKDFTSAGVGNTPSTFAYHPLWGSLKAGTIIIVGRPETSFTEDVDPADYLLVVKTNNATYLTSPAPFLFAGASDAAQVLNESNTHVVGVSWGTANAASLPSPKVHFTGSSTSNTSIAFNGNSVDSTVSTGKWTFNNAAPTPGLGNSTTNSAWIASFRSRADGSGSASIDPDTLQGGIVGTITITYTADTTYTITDLRIITPPAFLWSHDTNDIANTGMTAIKTVSGDTVTFSSIVLNGNTVTITFLSMAAPDSTGLYQFVVQSKAGVSFGDVGPIPKILVFGLPVPIADIKVNDVNGVALRMGQPVTLRGFVTVAAEFGGPSYIQDNSAGLSIFGSTFTSQVTRGDEVIVTGNVTQFNGLNQIENPILHSVVSQGNTVIPLDLTISQVTNDGSGGFEQYEGRLVEFRAVTLTDINNNPLTQWAMSGSGTNHRLHDATGFMDVRVDNNVDFANTPAPQSAFDLVGVVSQFKTVSPFIGGYQLMPRFAGDIQASGPRFLSVPRETNLTPTSLTIEWTTIDSGSSQVRYGLTGAYELGTAGSTELAIQHSISLSGLSPATMYSIQAFSVKGTDTSTSGRLIASTSSQGSTGKIDVYFNQSIDASVAVAETAKGNIDLVSKLVERIDAARYSVDVCLYSLSGSAGATVATALVNAKARGVKIRVIGEKDNQGTAPWSTLKNNGITVIDDSYDAVNGGAGLMHNKFLVFDYRGGSPDSIWVSTGSWNVTDPGSYNDMQNAIFIQDKALAGAITTELNEMWGSESDTPSAASSRFGARKTDNTPHRFVVNGVPLELYFSPSDRVTSRIISTVEKSTSSVYFALLTFTRSDISSTLKAKHDAGITVRGLFDNSSDQGSQFSFLSSNGIDVLVDVNSAFLHHKYAIIDSDKKNRPNFLITGSHNWSSSAENSNNENTLIVESNRLANLYLQEFKARYLESGGQGAILVKTDRVGNSVPLQFKLSQNYPNPFNPSTTVEYDLPSKSRITVKVYSILGSEVATLIDREQGAGSYRLVWNGRDSAGRGLSSGVYFLRMEGQSLDNSGQRFLQVQKMLLVK